MPTDTEIQQALEQEILIAMANEEAIKKALSSKNAEELEAARSLLAKRDEFKITLLNMISELPIKDAKANKLLGYFSGPNANFIEGLSAVQIEIKQNIQKNKREAFYQKHTP